MSVDNRLRIISNNGLIFCRKNCIIFLRTKIKIYFNILNDIIFAVTGYWYCTFKADDIVFGFQVKFIIYFSKSEVSITLLLFYKEDFLCLFFRALQHL